MDFRPSRDIVWMPAVTKLYNIAPATPMEFSICLVMAPEVRSYVAISRSEKHIAFPPFVPDQSPSVVIFPVVSAGLSRESEMVHTSDRSHCTKSRRSAGARLAENSQLAQADPCAY
jgi:hypothetical protein